MTAAYSNTREIFRGVAAAGLRGDCGRLNAPSIRAAVPLLIRTIPFRVSTAASRDASLEMSQFGDSTERFAAIR